MTPMQEAISIAFASSNPQILTLIEESVGQAMLEEAKSWPKRNTFEHRNDTKRAACQSITVAGVTYQSLDEARVALRIPEKVFYRLKRYGHLEDYISKRDAK